ncbi:uncharacterized protein [Parasteatoda tepidariorum]|uniref:uncharacterized protein n=1 Tax=Parasteatoda tepidariorum TaxID=114398 RepID=UPI0039BCE58E
MYPAKGLSEVSFHTDLPVAVNKQNDHPSVLRQAALERIYTIPTETVQIYTDGSKDEDNHTGSGIFIKSTMSEIKIQKRNPDHCSVFRSELIAIDDGLASILSPSIPKEIWILTDSRSAVQHLASWHRGRDNTSKNIFCKLLHLSKYCRIHVQWIPSHVDISGNEMADSLAKAGAAEANAPPVSLTSSELFSIAKAKNQSAWLTPPSRNWYQGPRPGSCLTADKDHQSQTAITRLRCGHLKSLRCSGGESALPSVPSALRPRHPLNIYWTASVF